jgi:hypothetical protein
MLIGICGGIGSGKDTVGRIIQSITQGDREEKIAEIVTNNWIGSEPIFEIVKFADPLKDIICILTGCTRKQLEDHDFKTSLLSKEWTTYNTKFNGNETVLLESLRTYRNLLQYLGTDLLREQLHEDVWVNALFNKYEVVEDRRCMDNPYDVIYPNWIITDVRFPNELRAIKARGGITINLNRINSTSQNEHIFVNKKDRFHSSETALVNSTFDYVIDNNGTMEELISSVREILIKEKII